MTLNTFQVPPPIKTSNNNDLMMECTLFKTIMSESYCTSTIIIFIRYLFFLNAILNKRKTMSKGQSKITNLEKLAR
jgi:hypothetical protein